MTLATFGYDVWYLRGIPSGDTGYLRGTPHIFRVGGCEQDWEFLFWGDIELSWFGHAKE